MDITLVNDKYGFTKLYDETLIVHCHHYNTTLQRTLLEPEYLNLRPYLQKASLETSFFEFKGFCERKGLTSIKEKLSAGEELIQFLGFGIIDLSDLTELGGTVKGSYSHYSNGWLAKMGQADAPVDLFLAGFIQAIACEVFNKMFHVDQVSCIAMGHNENIFEIKNSENSLDELKLISLKHVSMVIAPKDNFQSNINSEEVTNAVLGLGLIGDEDGKIDVFNVYLARTFSNYYNRITYKFEKEIIDAGAFVDLASELLIESAHNCGFYTMGGIMLSPEFDALVISKAKEPRDWMHGIISVINGLGWGQWRLMELEDNKRMVLRVYNSYESVGYMQLYGTRSEPCCYMVKGVASALMNLIYIGNIQSKPILNDDFYKSLFDSADTFFGTEISCSANGSSLFCELIIERK